MAGAAQVQPDQLLDGGLGFDDENVWRHEANPRESV
jgi:hypothetical protein